MWFAQFSAQRCHFTSLINYQVSLTHIPLVIPLIPLSMMTCLQMFQENAPTSLVLMYYTDFLETKGELHHVRVCSHGSILLII